ncbi:unnamed protein product [Rhodiola kirilowii]
MTYTRSSLASKEANNHMKTTKKADLSVVSPPPPWCCRSVGLIQAGGGGTEQGCLCIQC